MRKLLLALLCSIPAVAQVSSPGVVQVPTTPTSCNTLPLYVVANSNNLYGTNGSGGCSQIGGGGGMVYPGAGIANSTGSAWGTSYGTSNLIPANFLSSPVAVTSTCTVSAPGLYQNQTGSTMSCTLPTVTSGTTMSLYCFAQGNSNTGAITVTAPASTTILLNGVNTASAAAAVSNGTSRDSACFQAFSTTQYQATINNGVWNGASQTDGTYYAATFSHAGVNATEQTLFISTSPDGLNWKTVKDGGALFSPGSGLRDPSIAYINGTYWVAYTAQVNGGSANIDFGVASSPDLINWTYVAGPPGGGSVNTWAPEWFIDSDGSVHIIVATSSSGTNFNLYETHPTNAAYTTWSTPTALTWAASAPLGIDPFIVLTGGTYYLFYTGGVAGSEVLASASSLLGPYTVLSNPSGWPGTAATYEGASVLQISPGLWAMYLDGTPGGSGGTYYQTQCSGTFTGCTWTSPTAINQTISMEHGTFIHTYNSDIVSRVAAANQLPGVTLGMALNSNQPPGPFAAYEFFSGRSSSGTIPTNAQNADLGFQYEGSGGGFRHFIRTTHNGGTGSNTFQFYTNSSSTSTGSTQSGGFGNVLDMTLDGYGGNFMYNYQSAAGYDQMLTLLNTSNTGNGNRNCLNFGTSNSASGDLVYFCLKNGSSAANNIIDMIFQGGSDVWTLNQKGLMTTGGMQSIGTKFTTSGCSVSATTGGATAGVMTLGANTCSVVITFNGATGITATNGWSCHANDETTAAGNTSLYFSANSTTTATLSVPATAGSTDVVDFACTAY